MKVIRRYIAIVLIMAVTVSICAACSKSENEAGISELKTELEKRNDNQNGRSDVEILQEYFYTYQKEYYASSEGWTERVKGIISDFDNDGYADLMIDSKQMGLWEFFTVYDNTVQPIEYLPDLRSGGSGCGGTVNYYLYNGEWYVTEDWYNVIYYDAEGNEYKHEDRGYEAHYYLRKFKGTEFSTIWEYEWKDREQQTLVRTPEVDGDLLERINGVDNYPTAEGGSLEGGMTTQDIHEKYDSELVVLFR